MKSRGDGNKCKLVAKYGHQTEPTNRAAKQVNKTTGRSRARALHLVVECDTLGWQIDSLTSTDPLRYDQALVTRYRRTPRWTNEKATRTQPGTYTLDVYVCQRCVRPSVRPYEVTRFAVPLEHSRAVDRGFRLATAPRADRAGANTAWRTDHQWKLSTKLREGREGRT